MMTIKEYVEKIETVVSKQFDLDIDVIKSKSRVQELVDARDVLVYLLSKYLDFSITKIPWKDSSINHVLFEENDRRHEE